MSGQEFPLSLIIRAVDRATGPLRAVNEKIQQATAPARQLNNSVFELSKAAGMFRLAGAFEGVGKAAKGVWGALKDGALTFAGIVATGYGLLRVMHDIGGAGNDLKNFAQRTGLSVNAFAELRYAAFQADISAEEFAGAMDTLNKQLGQAKANTGKLAGLLNLVNPGFLQQLKAAKNNEAALDLLFEALVKLQDPNKRAALASAAFGNEVGKKMANLVANGTGSIAELRKEFRELAGDQEAFAEAGTQFDEQWKRATTALEGVRNAAAVAILPVLTELLKQFTGLVRENRAAITQWVQEFAANLPQHLETATTILKVLAFVITGKVVVALFSLMSSLYALGVALLTTPIGWFLLAVAAIAGVAYLIYKAWGPIKNFFSELWGDVKGSFEGNLDSIESLIKKFIKITLFPFIKTLEVIRDLLPDSMKSTVGGQALSKALDWVNNVKSTTATGAATGADQAKPDGQKTEARVVVDFNKAPPGTRATADPNGTADVDLSMGYAMPEIY